MLVLFFLLVGFLCFLIITSIYWLYKCVSISELINRSLHKFKIGTHVSVPKTYFILKANSTEPRFHAEVVKVLDNGDVCLRWDIDQTHSVVMQDDLKLETNLPGDITELQTPVDFVVPKPSGINYIDSMHISCKQTNKQ